MESKKKTTQTGNIKFVRQERKENFATLSTYHLQDNRLTTTEQLIFTKLLLLPPNFKISIRKTAYYFNISDQTFRFAINTFKKLGYLKTERLNQNETIYTIKEISDIQSDFNIYYLTNYSKSQLNYFLRNQATPTKYKKTIKAYLEKTKEYEKYVAELMEEKDNELF